MTNSDTLNKIVKDFSDQARQQVPSGVLEPDLWIEQYNLILARLILEECLSKIDELRDGMEEDGDHEQALGADWSALAVARHFGLE